MTKSPRLQMKSGYLDGQMLVAMPSMADPRFARSVIFLCAHSSEGAMGIVVNRRSRRLRFSDLLVQLEVIKPEDRIELPTAADDLQVLRGGPVDRSRGFVLHSPDYGIKDSTMEIEPGVSLTATIDILKAIATGEGPKRAVLALGYAGWSSGQLENEIQRNDWLNCSADSALIFDGEHDTKYDRAMRKIGIDPRMLSGEAGHA
jgi:putative transcriptional regulator